MPLGLYVSVPFCRTKCTYCNFASGVFSPKAYESYTQRVIRDIDGAALTANELGGDLPRSVDSIYLGGGTPSILGAEQLQRIFGAMRSQFEVLSGAEVTVECAPGTLTPAMTDTLLACGVNRVSLGVQSFVDREAQSVGRLHTRDTVLEEVRRLRRAGIINLNLDLIAGLPHQTAESWHFSLDEAIATETPHVSVYMLEIDDDSRLGRELIAGGTRYHAHFVPDENATADFYQSACEALDSAGIKQYEISNFAKNGWESKHNLKYWTRQPYLGFGVDAHSMLATATNADGLAIRFSTADSLDAYVAGAPQNLTAVSRHAALEETFFLGLRLTMGVEVEELKTEFGTASLAGCESAIAECEQEGLIEKAGSRVRLTPRGRLLSNEVFARFLSEVGVAGTKLA